MCSLRTPQQQAGTIHTGDGNRIVGHPIPQGERLAKVAEGLAEAEDRFRLHGSLDQSGKGPGQVVAGPTVIGELSSTPQPGLLAVCCL